MGDDRGMLTSSASHGTAPERQYATRVVLADDDVLLREGLASLLDRSRSGVVGQAEMVLNCFAIIVLSAHVEVDEAIPSIGGCLRSSGSSTPGSPR